MHAKMREFDWTASSLGPPDSWSGSMHAIVSLMLDSASPVCFPWGHELRLICNDAYFPIAGQRQPAALGAKMQDVFAELWTEIDPIAQQALQGESSFHENVPAEIIRCGRPARGWF